MVQPPGERNAKIMQWREGEKRERGPATDAPLPYPNEIVGRKAPPYHGTGADALSPLLMHIAFPATREEIKQAIGQARIPVDRTRTERVDAILDRLGPETYRSSREVEDAVKRLAERTGGIADDVRRRKPN